MKNFKDRFRKNLFEPNSTQAKTLLDLIDNEFEKEIIKLIFVDGLTTKGVIPNVRTNDIP